MSSGDRLRSILQEISKELNDNVDNVQKCDVISQDIRKFYLEDIEPFLGKYKRVVRVGANKEQRKKNDIIKSLFHSSAFYCKKAQEYFGFFGIDFHDPSKSKQITTVPAIAPEQLSHFLYSSIQLLYVVLWEVFRNFLQPLERLYYLRLCHSGIFPKHYPMFPTSGEIETIELDFVYDILRGGGTLFRVSESFPFELRLLNKVNPYFKDCFENARKEVGATTSEDFIDDFIRLFIIRNNVCHIGKGIVFQEIHEKRIQNLLYSLTTYLPRIQNSCIGIISVFKALANKEPERQ